MLKNIPETLSDYDLLELIVFDRKVDSEGFSYAAEEYGPKFEFNNFQPLPTSQVGDLWRAQRATIDAWWEAHPEDGCDLHNAHVDESRRRERDRALWAVRFDNGNLFPCQTEAYARLLAATPGPGKVQDVLRRDEPGGEWIPAPKVTSV